MIWMPPLCHTLLSYIIGSVRLSLLIFVFAHCCKPISITSFMISFNTYLRFILVLLKRLFHMWMWNYVVAVLLPTPVLRLLSKFMPRILTFYTEEVSLMSVLLPLSPSSDKHFLSIDVGKKCLHITSLVTGRLRLRMVDVLIRIFCRQQFR